MVKLGGITHKGLTISRNKPCVSTIVVGDILNPAFQIHTHTMPVTKKISYCIRGYILND